jgi:benzodiazapine receptor
MSNDRLRQWLNVILVCALIVVATLVSAGITGPSIGALSDRYPTYVVPAGYAFMIWNLIFGLGLAYSAWQLMPAQRERPLLRQVGWLTVSAWTATTVWMLVFQRALFGLSVVVMLWLLVSLIGVSARLQQYPAPFTPSERWLVYVNFSIFLGWVTVATVANVGQMLTAWGWDGWLLPAEMWGGAALLLAGVVATAVTVKLRGNLPYALAVIWALVAIAVNQFSRAVPTSSLAVGGIAVAMTLQVSVALLLCRWGRIRGFTGGQPARRANAQPKHQINTS